MLKRNEGTLDRILRVVLGVALLAGYYFNGDGAYSWLYLLGVIPLVTGAIGSCPLYSIFGISTCPMKKG
jgi:hypothetical protein